MLAFNTDNHEFIMSLDDSICNSVKDEVIEYKGFLYSISTKNRNITYIGPADPFSNLESLVGAMYYGFSYMHSLKTKLMGM